MTPPKIRDVVPVYPHDTRLQPPLRLQLLDAPAPASRSQKATSPPKNQHRCHLESWHIAPRQRPALGALWAQQDSASQAQCQSRHGAQRGTRGSDTPPTLPAPPPEGLHLLILACCYLCQPAMGLREDAAAQAVNSFQPNTKQVKSTVSRSLPTVLICTRNQS